MRRLFGIVLPFLGFLAFFGAGIYFQDVIIRKKADQQEKYYDFLYLPSSRYVQAAAVGYDHFFADFFFLRVIQAFGASYARPVNLGQLWAYFDSITDLDPHFLAAYTFGNLVLGDEHGDPEKAIAILDKGIEKNPGKYRLPFEAAFYALWIRQDPDAARTYVQIAEAAPDAPDFVRRWEGFIDEQMGRYHAAFIQYLTEYIRAVEAGEDTLIEINLSRLRSAIDQWYKAELREKAMAYHEQHGVYPSVSQLNAAGAFLDVEWPDWQALATFLDQAAETGRKIDSSDEAIEALAQRFTHKGWTAMPPNPSSHPIFRGYVVWPGQEPITINGTDNRLFLGSELNIAIAVKEEMVSAASRIRQYQAEHEGECPPDLEAVSPALAKLQEPWGGSFVLDRERCVVYPSTYPNLIELIGRARKL